MRIRHTKKEDEARLRSITDNRIKCKCGHSVLMPQYKDFIICNWCGMRVYRNSQIEFRYKMQQQMKNKFGGK